MGLTSPESELGVVDEENQCTMNHQDVAVDGRTPQRFVWNNAISAQQSTPFHMLPPRDHI